MEVSVGGQCCTTTYPGDGRYVPALPNGWACEGLCDPSGFPITRDCQDEAQPGDEPDGVKCRRLPPFVASKPGVVELPEGCQAALDKAGLCAPSPANDFSCGAEDANESLTVADIGDEDELWSKMCFLPQWDQDFDGLGDACDLCKFVFDPFNTPDANSPDVGAVCSDPEQTFCTIP